MKKMTNLFVALSWIFLGLVLVDSARTRWYQTTSFDKRQQGGKYRFDTKKVDSSSFDSYQPPDPSADSVDDSSFTYPAASKDDLDDTSVYSGSHLTSKSYPLDPFLDAIHYDNCYAYYTCSADDENKEFSIKKCNKYFGFLYFSDEKQGNSNENLYTAAHAAYKILNNDQVQLLLDSINEIAGWYNQHDSKKSEIVNLLYNDWKKDSLSEAEMEKKLELLINEDFNNYLKVIASKEAQTFAEVGKSLSNTQLQLMKSVRETSAYDGYGDANQFCSSSMSQGNCEVFAYLLARCLTYWISTADQADLIDRGFFSNYFCWSTTKAPYSEIEQQAAKSYSNCDKGSTQLANTRHYVWAVMRNNLGSSQISILDNLKTEAKGCIADLAGNFRRAIDAFYRLKDGTQFSSISKDIDDIFSDMAAAEICYTLAQAKSYKEVYYSDAQEFTTLKEELNSFTIVPSFYSWYKQAFNCK